MNISGKELFSLSSGAYNWTVNISDSKKAVRRLNTAKSEAESFQEEMIERFKAANNPRTKKLEEIKAKFMGGKELSPDELAYLAKNAPEFYQMVQEVMMERKQLEMKLAAAKSKLEVAEAYADSIAMVEKTKGTGETEKRNVFKTMCRLNHLSDCYGKFVATPEYRELEDEGDKAEKIREEVEENSEAMEEAAENSEVSEEVPAEDEAIAEEVPAEDEAAEVIAESKPEISTAAEKERERQQAEGRRKSRKKNRTEKENPFIQAQVTLSASDLEFRRKVHNLYRGYMTGRQS